jgi:hypothetical protein
MGAQSDFIAERFVPCEHYSAKQLAMARALLASGIDAEQLAKMFLIPVGVLLKDTSANL